MAKNLSPTSRVLEALEDHTMIEVIAAAAEVSAVMALAILIDLARKGTVKQCAEGCWERV